MENADGCGARGCAVYVYDPVRLRKLKEWAESDAEFLRKLCVMQKDKEKTDKLSASLSLIFYTEPSHQSFDERFACRQRYLRSYKFRRETDTIVDETKKWLKEKKRNNDTQKNEAKDGSCSLLKGGVKFLFSCIARVQSRKSYH